jgi:hypothetical protein
MIKRFVAESYVDTEDRHVLNAVNRCVEKGELVKVRRCVRARVCVRFGSFFETCRACYGPPRPPPPFWSPAAIQNAHSIAFSIIFSCGGRVDWTQNGED